MENSKPSFKNKIRRLIREELGNFTADSKDKTQLSVEHVRKVREKIESVVADLEDILMLVDKSGSTKTGWVEGIVEEQKDVYQELMDLETELRTSSVNESQLRDLVREKIKIFLSEKASEEYCKNTPKSEMGFTQKASCKAQGYIARSDGEKKKSDKYK